MSGWTGRRRQGMQRRNQEELRGYRLLLVLFDVRAIHVHEDVLYHLQAPLVLGPYLLERAQEPATALRQR